MEILLQLGNDDLIANAEAWWDDSHNWNTMIEGSKHFRRDRPGRRGGELPSALKSGWAENSKGCEKQQGGILQAHWSAETGQGERIPLIGEK